MYDLYDYKTIYDHFSETTHKKKKKRNNNNVEYLSPESVELAFFDGEISDDSKINMVQVEKCIRKCRFNN